MSCVSVIGSILWRGSAPYIEQESRPVRPHPSRRDYSIRHLPRPSQFRCRRFRVIMAACPSRLPCRRCASNRASCETSARWEITPARPARYASFPPELDPRLIDALAGRGVTALYTHQADAVAAALRGEHVAVVTPAASGKTLCYNLPVLNRLLADPSARALYLFPTKALAQDQLAELRELTGLLNGEGETSRQVNKGAKPLQTLGASSPRPLRSPLLRSPARPTTATPPRRSVPRCATRLGSSSRTRTCCTPASCRNTRVGRAFSPTSASS